MSSGPAAEPQRLGMRVGDISTDGALSTADRKATLEPRRPGVTWTTTQGGDHGGANWALSLKKRKKNPTRMERNQYSNLAQLCGPFFRIKKGKINLGPC